VKYNPSPGIFIGLGANLGDPVQQLTDALADIDSHADIKLLERSHFYSSAPMGPQDQPNYINAVCKVSTNLLPIDLLHALQAIELSHGRVRKAERWGARTLDLDLLLYGNEYIKTEELTVPHYGMSGREFVLVPLFEIQPDLIMPNNQPIAHWIRECDLTGLTRLMN
jgi:2-amino-4-hydroxy-6-hydroxymethyldihydropteridine diphosphokinase